MGFEHACFISYRHRNSVGYTNNIKKLVELLNEELGMQFDGDIPVFLDNERLTIGQELYKILPDKICKSVSMIVVWIPPYFSREKLYCSKEYYTMEHLEQKRKALLKDSSLSFIHIIAFQRPEKMPEKIKNVESRFFGDFKDIIIEENWHTLVEVKKKIRKIADYIADRHDQLKELGDQPFQNCLVDFPDDTTVKNWLSNLNKPTESTTKPPSHYEPSN